MYFITKPHNLFHMVDIKCDVVRQKTHFDAKNYAFSVKSILMTQDFVKLLHIQQIINLSNVRSITHVICVSRQVSIKPTPVPRSWSAFFAQGCITLTIIQGKKSMIITKRKRDQTNNDNQTVLPLQYFLPKPKK